MIKILKLRNFLQDADSVSKPTQVALALLRCIEKEHDSVIDQASALETTMHYQASQLAHLNRSLSKANVERDKAIDALSEELESKRMAMAEQEMTDDGAREPEVTGDEVVRATAARG